MFSSYDALCLLLVNFSHSNQFVGRPDPGDNTILFCVPIMALIASHKTSIEKRPFRTRGFGVILPLRCQYVDLVRLEYISFLCSFYFRQNVKQPSIEKAHNMPFCCCAFVSQFNDVLDGELGQR